MRYAVCVKQVPVIARLEFDPATKTLRREGVPTEVSSFDVRALIRALELRDSTGGEVVVLTMGPPQAQEALDYCLALGADRSVHLCDPAFAGADTLATARTLARALEREAPDVILLGRYSVDAETSQVGPEIAELLGMPQILAAHRLDLDVDSRRAAAECETDDGYVTVTASLPVVVTAAEDLAPERFPKKADREAAAGKPRQTVNLAELGAAPDQVGAAGSPTWVTDLRAVPSQRLGRIFDPAADPDAIANLVTTLVDEHGLFSRWRLPVAADDVPAASAPVRRSLPGDLWCVVDSRAGRVANVSLEIVARLRQLADRIDGRVSAIVLNDCPDEELGHLAGAGADRVLVCDRPRAFGLSRQVALLAAAIAVHAPGALVFPATTFGRDIAPRLAARLGLGLTSDCIDLDWDSCGRLVQLKPAFGGTVVAPVLSRTIPELATVRPGVLPPATEAAARPLDIERIDGKDAVPTGRDVEILSARATIDGGADLDGAEIVLGIGKGVGGPEGIDRILPLAELLGASLCATRDVTDDGWLPRQLQVGLTGRAIAPKLYIGLGIRGAFEHMVGLRRAGIVVAVNKNAKAMVFKSADYGIVGTIEEVVPQLITQLTERRRHLP
jgi:electron transfer flavoprotein alpha subunit